VAIATEDLKIRQKIEDMMVYAYQALNQYPKHEKHSLVAETKASMLNLLRQIIVCSERGGIW
jgi:hypothetical protein